MPRPNPPAAEIAAALDAQCPELRSGPLTWTAATSAVRRTFHTNNETARRWLDFVTLEDEPLVLRVEVRAHGRLGRVARLNIPAYPFFNPDSLERLIMLRPSVLGYGPAADGLVFGPDGHLWAGEGDPPRAGWSINKGRESTSCLMLPATLVALAAAAKRAAAPPTLRAAGAVVCRCGYPAENGQDLDDHVLAVMHVTDGTHHG